MEHYEHEVLTIYLWHIYNTSAGQHAAAARKDLMEKRVCELFAGVGGFRVGLERLESGWETVWFSQWEPGKTKQWAHECYVRHFGDSPDANGDYCTGIDIGDVDKRLVPDHDLLVGGFPCQDYSVAHPLSSSQGIEGVKGVLWWQIRDVLIVKRPPFVLLENVDRLLRSPADQRGRDFGIMLTCLAQLGYTAEWRVVNAADYGAAQRRRRTFIFAYQADTSYARSMEQVDARALIEREGFMATAFPVEDGIVMKDTTLDFTDVSANDRVQLYLEGTLESDDDLINATRSFKYDFKNAGYMKAGTVYTAEVTPKYEAPLTLYDVAERGADEKYYITGDKLAKWVYLKGAKKIDRTSKSGHSYKFSEGPIAFPDPLDRPARTMLTSESTLNRSTHIISDPATGRLRTLTPVEAERLQGFPDGWTEGMPERMRYFCMGNALVVPMITRMGRVLDNIFSMEDR